MNDETLLHRIIKPNWWLQADNVSSQSFRPTPEDQKRLSVYDGDRITPESAWQHYIREPGKPLPAGVLAVTVAECSDQDLPAIPDPDTFAEHVLIDFSEFGNNQIRRKSAWLRDRAVARGWLFGPVQG